MLSTALAHVCINFLCIEHIVAQKHPALAVVGDYYVDRQHDRQKGIIMRVDRAFVLFVFITRADKRYTFYRHPSFSVWNAILFWHENTNCGIIFSYKQ